MDNRSTPRSVADNPTVRSFIEKQGTNNSLVRKYVAGTTLREALLTAKELHDRHYVCSFEFLGETVLGPEDSERHVQSNLELIRQISIFSPDASLVVRLPFLGLDISEGIAKENLHRLTEEAKLRGNILVRVDMDDSSYTSRVLKTVCEEHRSYFNIGTVVQANLRRTEKDINSLIQERVSVRLVPGIFVESPAISLTKKSDIDGAFRRYMYTLLENGYHPTIGTEDEDIIKVARTFIRQHSIAPDKYEFEFPFGARRELMNDLVKEGHTVRVSVPFGPFWYPHFSKRLAEHPISLMNIFKT